MNKQLILLFIFLLPFVGSAQEESKNIEQFVNELDKKIPQLLHDFIVPGAAIAIIENGEIILQKGYGYSDIEKGIKVNSKTGFNIGSISKTVAAWGVMKLVQEGKIELDAPAEKYLSRWHLPKSEFDSKEVTVRRLLSHTAGLSLHGYPGWSPKDKLPTIKESLNGKNNGPGRVEIIMEPGTKWKYSGGGFSILQLIIEEVTGQIFEDYMQAQILNPLGMASSSYKIDDKIMAASSLEYNAFGEAIDFELFTAQAAAGLHTTIEDFTRFAKASLYGNKDHKKYAPILPANIIQQMMEPAEASDGRYGLGYQVFPIQGASMVLRGHGGANTGWHAFFKVDPVANDGFIMVTNGGAGYNIYNQIFCDWVYWKTGESVGRRCQIKPSIANKMKFIIDSEGIDNIGATYTELKKNQPEKYNFSENQLNELGYHYLGKDNIENAIAIFKLNVDAFPNAFNVYDSYGEALLKQGNKEQAIENYKQSVKLNPGNQGGISVLKELGVNTDDLIVKVPIEHLKLLEGDYEITNPPTEKDGDWKIAFDLENGVLYGNDRGYRYKLIPVGKDKFVNPDDGASLVFDTKDKDAITFVLFEKFKFKKKINKKEANNLSIEPSSGNSLFLTKNIKWQNELIEFPLGFAPAIKYEGYEDLRFLKGWRDHNSDEFWSYGFAWVLDKDPQISASILSENMNHYYDGLMKLNSNSDDKKTKTNIVKTTNAANKYSGTIETIDAFFTKKPLKLNVQIETSYCEAFQKHVVLFRLSPKGFDENIWEQLEMIEAECE